ncbi:MAG: MFS transporter [Alphaproteobacteria bacterium]|nr:MFS transporter [Alphaproteobacteria bacterium]
MTAISHREVFRHPAFTLLWTGRLLTTIATLMQSVAVGWQVYTVARLSYDVKTSSFLVGMVGLVQFLPMFALALLAGETADRYDRRKILFACVGLQIICAALFTFLSSHPMPSLTAIFAVAALFGVARAFAMPASNALTPRLVPAKVMPNAIAWMTLSTQGGMVLGPWLGGVLCAISPFWANATAGGLYVVASLTGIALLMMPIDAKPRHSGGRRIAMIKEGLTYLWSNKIVLGAISLDLFAVLLGGVTALLPVFAHDILHIGADGFGQLRSSAAIGGGAVTLVLSRYPITRRAGAWMLGAVMVYGVATTIFAFAREIWLSMAMLVVLGAADSISVFVRQSLVQIVTPDPMRGRVSAVSSLFISASNELGEFESGVAARLLGPVGAVVFGGLGSIAVTLLWAKLFPALRKADRLEAPEM